MFTRSALPVAVAALALSAAVAPAGAGVSEPGSVSLNVNSAPTFRGQVSSDEKACVADRKVTLLAMGTGGRYFPLGDDRTNARGKWQVSSQLDGATSFQAKVKSSTADGVRCEAAASPVRSVG